MHKKTQFNLSVNKELKTDFSTKCNNECRELSSVIEFLMKQFLDCKIKIPEFKIKNDKRKN